MISKKLKKKRKKLYSFDSNDFEKLVVTALSKFGWKAYKTKKSKDGGIDIIATKKFKVIGHFKIICQVKKNNISNPVGINIVRELGFLIQQNKATKGLIVTTSRLTKGALKLINQNQHNMSAISYIQIEDLIYQNIEEDDGKDLLF